MRFWRLLLIRIAGFYGLLLIVLSLRDPKRFSTYKNELRGRWLLVFWLSLLFISQKDFGFLWFLAILIFSFIALINKNKIGWFSMALGQILNSLVISLNKGMPFDDGLALEKFGPFYSIETEGYVAINQNTKLVFLSDWISDPLSLAIISPGDILIITGFLIICFKISFGNRLQKN